MSYLESIETAQAPTIKGKQMFAIYEVNTNQIVAWFDDRRLAASRAKSLTAEHADEGYEFRVKRIR